MKLYIKLKYFLEPIAGIILIILIAPIMFFISILLKLESKGTIFIKQKRLGKNGQQINIFKFRTMYSNSEQLRNKFMSSNEQEGPVFKIKYDPRITQMGRFLKKTGLDSLPQLINVIKGEMSIVGPRPIFINELQYFTDSFKSVYFKFKPGIMSPTILFGKRFQNPDIDTNQLKILLMYKENASIIIDIKILIAYFNAQELRGY